MSNENETKQIAENEDEAFLRKYDTVFAFLSLETLALLCFGFGGSLGLTILRILGFFLSLLTMGFAKQNATPENRKAFWIGILPFAAFAIFLGFSSFWFSFGGGGLNAIISDLTVVLGFAGAFLLGYHVKHIKAAKPDYILLALGAGLALIVIVTGIYGFIRYGFFYSALYNGKVYYYDGVVYTVSTETKALIGFEFLEVSMRFGKAASVILGSTLSGLFFISPKKDLKRFIAVAVFGGIGLLDLVLTPYQFGILAVLGTVAVLGIVRLLNAKASSSEAASKGIGMARKIVFYILIGLFAVGTALLVVDASGTAPGRILSNIGPLSGLVKDGGFLYPVERGINAVLYSTGSDGIRRINPLGMLFGASYSGQSGNQLSRMFEFNVLWQNGFVGFLLLAFFAFTMVKQSDSFLQGAKEEDSGYRAIIVAALLAGFVYFTFGDDELPLRHADSQLFAFTRGNFILVLLFLSGLIYQAKETKEVAHE